jgi:oxygen-independent coproporphyrinogen-3 oxidase
MKLSLYIHIPFCVKRCNYCDFNTYAGEEKSIPAYMDAVSREIQFQGKNQPEGYLVHTIYIGGGTPTLLNVKQVGELLVSLNSSFELQKETEISIEANPGTLTQKKLEGLLENGINRLSIGVQSFQDDELKMLGRIHSVKEADKAYTIARKAGFENINLDLIYGLPGQDLGKWEESLEYAIKLNPNHLSLYSLTIEKGTLLDSQIQCRSLQEPDEDLSADMLEWAISRLDKAGYEQYEVSNWCRVDSNGKKWQSDHNIQYWLNEEYLGFGAGAHSFAASTRTDAK